MKDLNIGLDTVARVEVAGLLKHLLADEVVLYTKTRGAHWNVTGPHFHALHAFFESQYDTLAETIDEVAERIKALGHHAPATLQAHAANTRLQDNEAEATDGTSYILTLLADHESLCRNLRNDIKTAAGHNDDGTADFLTGLLESHEKMAWMLRSHL